MTHNQVAQRIERFNEARKNQEITAKEWEALMKALTQVQGR
jgi:hypothetical protein